MLSRANNLLMCRAKDEKSLRKMHEQIGIAEDDMPISIKFLPSKE